MTRAGTRGVRSIQDVSERQLCSGCGACAYVQPDAIRMVDVVDQGRRPALLPVADGGDVSTGEALRACPGISLAHEPHAEDVLPELLGAWGPVLEVWEGYAGDPEIRFAASSGGAATALALHAVEHEGMHGVLHIAAREDVPYLNHTVMSRGREQLLAATGSRYAPASPCDGLQMVEDAPDPCVFIGKPCDVAGARKSADVRPALAAKLGLTIGIFCAGTPTLEGTFEMIRAMGYDDPSEVKGVRYRGNGWPGAAVVEVERDGAREVRQLSYDESWGDVLQKHRQWRCHVCADHTGEFADVAVGDPWYRPIPAGEPGRSLVLVRTERGRRLVRAAIARGSLVLERADPQIVIASQPALLRTRGSVWGRVATMRAVGLSTPRYRNLPTFPAWLRHLSLREKLRSIYGTLKRIVTRKLYRRRKATAFEPPPPGPCEAAASAGSEPGGSYQSSSP